MGTLTTDRLLGLVSALVEVHGNAVGAAVIVAAARAAPWGEPYRYQRVYTALIRCEVQGVLQRARAPNSVRGRGTRRESYVWWPTYTEREHSSSRDEDEAQTLDLLVDHAVARANVGTVISARWIVTKLTTVRPSTTDDEVRATLRRRRDDQRPVLTECSVVSGWAGWWRVSTADPVRGSLAGRTASDALWRRVRAAQRLTGRTAVEVRAITRSASPSRRGMLTARVAMACRIPKPNTNCILLTPRLVRCGAVHYASYVAPLGEEHIAAAELDVEAWWYAAQLLEHRYDQDRRWRQSLGDAAMTSARRLPYVSTYVKLRKSLQRFDELTNASDRDAAWCARATMWCRANPWEVSADEMSAEISEPPTWWLTIPELQRMLASNPNVRRAPSVRLLRMLLQHAGVWMRPAMVVSAESMLRTANACAADAGSSVVAEAIDAHVWIHGRYLNRGSQISWRWVRRWLGLSRDWDCVATVARQATHRWSDLARLSLKVKATVARSSSDRLNARCS